MDWRMMSIIFVLFSIACCTEIDTQEVKSGLQNSNESTNIQQQNNVADAVNDFGYKLILTMLKQNKDQNIVISPTSVAGLLAMTLLGTVGKTHEELAEALGFSQDILLSRKNHEQFGDLLKSLNANETTTKTLYADAIFVDTQEKLRDMYRGYLGRVYSGEARSVDFNQANEAKDTLNQWVDLHTEGKIETFLKKPLPIDTKAVLMSALYFRGQWQTPFLEEFTKGMAFKTPTKDVVADLMLNTGDFRYIYSQEHDMHMVALPYNDSITTLYALKPRVSYQRPLTLHELMTRLDSTKINQLIDKMENAKCIIRFPKMDLQSNAKLEDPLKALGVQSLFTAGQANFALMVDSNTVPNKTEVEIISRMNGESDASNGEVNTRRLKEILDGLPNPGLHVDSVIHDVKLTINEYGTEAVAATSGVLARSANLFYADSPFYMFIRNERTKLITFSAVINDPTITA